MSESPEQDIGELIRHRASRYAAPAELRRNIRLQLPSSSPAYRPILSWVGWSSSFAVGMLVMFLLRPLGVFDDGNAFLDSHMRALQAAHLTDVPSSDQHTVKPWFSGKLSYAPPVHNFEASGFPLIGGRLDVIHGQNIAALVYGRDKHIIDVFVLPPDSDMLWQCSAQLGFHAQSWHSAGMAWCAVSDLNDQELHELAHLIQSQS
jgi:anti-sigma factor RsiW